MHDVRVNVARSKDAQRQIGANVLKRATNNFQSIRCIFGRFTILKCEKFIKANTIFRLAAISLLRIKRKIKKKYISYSRILRKAIVKCNVLHTSDEFTSRWPVGLVATTVRCHRAH